jgi:polar amino acid transport system substrate-binding protein
MVNMLKTMLLAVSAATILLAASNVAADDDKRVQLTTLEWPPYTSESLPEGGASVVVAKAAFAAMGYTLEVSFYPWSRAVGLGEAGEDFDGYFPRYYTADVRKSLSEPMGAGPLGFAVKAGSEIEWQQLSDLATQQIGVVGGYNNTDEFDAAVAAGELNVMATTTDINNLRMLATDRLDMAVIDANVMDYLLLTQAPDIREALAFHPRLLEDKTLHVAFSPTARGAELLEVFNKGLEKVDVDALMQAYFEAR